MNEIKSNIDLLHEAGAINKSELSATNIAAINSLTKEEVEQIKSSNQSSVDVQRTAGVSF